MNLLFVIILILSFQFHNVQIAANFNADRLRLVDSPACQSLNSETECAQRISSTFHSSLALLTRGNAPLNASGKFDAAMIIEAVNARIKTLSRNSTFDLRTERSISLKVISLVSSYRSDENDVLKEEMQGAELSWEKMSVELTHWPVGGWTISLAKFAHPILTPLFSFLDFTGGAWELATFLHENLNKARGVTIIYVHCMRGIDRTGLVAGTYSLRFQGSSLEEVDNNNFSVARRELNFAERTSLYWIHEKLERKQT